MNPKRRQQRARAKAKKSRIMRNPLGAKAEAVAILKDMNAARARQVLVRQIRREAEKARRTMTPAPEPLPAPAVAASDVVTASIPMARADLEALTEDDLKFIGSEVSERLTNATLDAILPE